LQSLLFSSIYAILRENNKFLLFTIINFTIINFYYSQEKSYFASLILSSGWILADFAKTIYQAKDIDLLLDFCHPPFFPFMRITLSWWRGPAMLAAKILILVLCLSTLSPSLSLSLSLSHFISHDFQHYTNAWTTTYPPANVFQKLILSQQTKMD